MLTSIILPALLTLAAAYLSGSVNYAIIVTKAVTGKDIRTIGNLNPGTSNVVRNVGKGWGILVMALDALKGVVIILAAKLIFFPENGSLHLLILYLAGVCAVLGHRYPLFYGFKGGGGIGTMQGISLFFVLAEYLFSMLLGGLIVILFFKNVKHKYGQWTPILFVILTPFVTLATSLTVSVPLFSHIAIGGHPAGLVIGTFVMSLTLLGINIGFMKKRVGEVASGEADGSTGRG